MANKVVLFHEIGTGKDVPVVAVDQGDGTFLLGVDASNVTVGAITVTTVPIKDGVTNTLANVDAPASLTSSSKALAVHDPAPSPQVANPGAFDASFAESFGVAGAMFTSADQSGAAAAVTDAPSAGKKLVITDIIISVGDTGQTVTLTEQTSGTVKGKYYVPANTTITIPFKGKFKLDTADKKLMVQTSVTGNVAVGALYYSEA